MRVLGFARKPKSGQVLRCERKVLQYSAGAQHCIFLSKIKYQCFQTPGLKTEVLTILSSALSGIQILRPG